MYQYEIEDGGRSLCMVRVLRDDLTVCLLRVELHDGEWVLTGSTTPGFSSPEDCAEHWVSCLFRLESQA